MTSPNSLKRPPYHLRQKKDYQAGFKYVGHKFLINWRIFAYSLIICIGLTFVYYYFAIQKVQMIGIIGVFLGVAIPAFYIIFSELLFARISSSEDIRKVTNIPVIGQIGRVADEKILMVNNVLPAAITQQLLDIDHHLQLPKAVNKAETLLFTSSISGEGKSFLALNFARVLASEGKKVVLLDLDLRKQKLSNNLHLIHQPGYKEYLTSDTGNVDEVLHRVSSEKNIFLIPAGFAVENPQALLTDSKLNKLLSALKDRFDYIIVDCAPVGLVSDALLIAQFADAILYIVRRKYTYKTQLEIVNDLKNIYKTQHFFIVLNDAKV